MESIIINALVAGAAVAAKDLTAKVIKESYAGLKKLIVSKFGQKTDIADTLHQLEKKPDSKARQEVLVEELSSAGVHNDDEIINQARKFLELFQQFHVGSGNSYQAELHGDGAIAQGPGAVAAGARGLA